jgi:hypothetical protein
VLEADSLGRKEVASPSIFDSLTAAMSMVQSCEVSDRDSAYNGDRYMTEYGDPGWKNSQSLCAHHFAFGVDQKTELLDPNSRLG